MLPFSSFALESCEFFFESHVDQTVDRLGTRVEFTETEDLSKKSAGRRQRNLVTVEVFESVSPKNFACSPAWSPDNHWSEMIRAPRDEHLRKDASDGWFLTAYVRLLESPYKCKSARKF